MNRLQKIFYRGHIFFVFPAFWREVKQTRRFKSTIRFWNIEEESTRNP